MYDAALTQYHYIHDYWKAEDLGHVTAKIDEQKTKATKQKVLDLVAKL
ncbi:MAG: hypothetical protein IJT12_06115 [Paludibacteraceae bacterium]|nr:hypothetical protein [Paludibacteraceae bacterium]